eukprot:80851-Pleurochrysis_carterae.AAC.1
MRRPGEIQNEVNGNSDEGEKGDEPAGVNDVTASVDEPAVEQHKTVGPQQATTEGGDAVTGQNNEFTANPA